MTLEYLKSYFEGYAARHVDLQHVPGADKSKWKFFCMDTDQSTSEFIRTAKMDLFMILMPYHKTQNKTNAANYTWNKHVAFMILKRVPGKEQDAIIAAKSLCEVIGDDFCTRIINDRHIDLDSTEDGTMAAEPVGPLGDNYYGQIYMFTWLDWFDQRVNPDRWIG